MSETADDDEDLERPRFIRMRAEDTFDGQERVFTRAAYDLQVQATAHSARCGHPGYVPDDYLEHLDGLGIETTITAAELCAIGTWERVGGGYRVLDWEAAEVCLDQVRQDTGEDPRALAWDREHEARIQARMATPMVVTPPCAACGTPATHIELLAPASCPPDGTSGLAPHRAASCGHPGQDSGTSCARTPPPATATAAPSTPAAPGASPGRSGFPCALPRSAPQGSTTTQDSAPTAKSPTATSTGTHPTPDTATAPTDTAKTWTRSGRR